MKKKLLIFLSLLMLSISLVGCGSTDGNANTKPNIVNLGGRTFLKIDDGDTGDDYLTMSFIYVDIETGVQYLVVDGYRATAMDVIVDAYGDPILYEGELN